MLPVLDPSNPLKDLFARLAKCWSRAAGDTNPEQIGQLWDSEFAKIPETVRACQAAATSVQRTEFITTFQAFAGPWGEWVFSRLSQSNPFLSWNEWQMRSRLIAGPAVGQLEPIENAALQDETQALGYMLPVRVFVLPRQILSDVVLPPQDHKLGDPSFWPHGPLSTKVMRHVPVVLRWCVIRNLLSFAIEPLTLVLLTLIVLLVAGFVIWGNSSEPALQYLLISSVSVVATLACLVVWEIVREFILVRREGWFHTWRNSAVRIVGDPETLMVVDGDSCALALLLATISGLTERVVSQNPDLNTRSRFWHMMLP